MPKPIIVLVHGMGKHPPGAITDSFVKNVDITLFQIASAEGKSISELADIREINYDVLLDELRQKMANDATSICNQLKALGVAQWPLSFIDDLASFEYSLGKDRFFNTHCLDVFLYSTYVGAMIRQKVAKEIYNIHTETEGSFTLHIIAHSLGTAVIHDTLALLYSKDFSLLDNKPNLDLTSHKLGSLWLLANVSRITNKINEIQNPYKSVVRPGEKGCTNRLVNIHHKLDPFTWPSSFKPEDDGIWRHRKYKDIEISDVTSRNTHDFGEYILNPDVCLPLLNRVLHIKPTVDEKKAINNNFRKYSISDDLDEFKTAYKNCKDDDSSIKNFLKASFEFSKALKGAVPDNSGNTQESRKRSHPGSCDTLLPPEKVEKIESSTFSENSAALKAVIKKEETV